jgi:hypothetical protein
MVWGLDGGPPAPYLLSTLVLRCPVDQLLHRCERRLGYLRSHKPSSIAWQLNRERITLNDESVTIALLNNPTAMGETSHRLGFQVVRSLGMSL